MNILIFGGIGFIGVNIALEALKRGHKVIAFDNLQRSGVMENLQILKNLHNFTFSHGDIRNREDFKNLPTSIDCIINLAANPSVPRSIIQPVFDFEINVVGHLNILEYAKNHGRIPVIFASSNKVYTDKINTLPIRGAQSRYIYANKRLHVYGIDETADVGGHDGFTNSPYGAAKLSAEKYSREYWKQYGIPLVINRMSCIYGLYQKGVEEQGWVDWFLRAKKKQKPIIIYGDGKQVRDVLFGTDVAKLYIYEAEHMKEVNGKTFNVGGGPGEGFNISLLEIIHLIDAEFSGRPLRYTFRSWRSSDQRIYISDIRKVVAATPWKPTTKILNGLTSMWKSYDLSI